MTKIPNRPKESSLMSNYSRSDLEFVRGKGVRLFDKKGKVFLDLGSGIAVNSLGHSHPKLVKVLADQDQNSGILQIYTLCQNKRSWRMNLLIILLRIKFFYKLRSGECRVFNKDC